VTGLLVSESVRRKLEFVCPRTGAPLHWDETEITCPSTGERWERAGDIPVLSRPEDDRGEIPRGEMESLLRDAETLGWERALSRRFGEPGDRVSAPGGDGVLCGPDTESGAPLGELRVEGAADSSRADWRFLLPLTETSRVLDMGAGWGEVTTAIAPEVGVIAASDELPEKARFLEIRARQSGLDNVFPYAASVQDIPFPDGTFDLVILRGELAKAGLSRIRRNPRDVQKLVLRNIRRKLAPGGHLYVATENRWGYPYLYGMSADPTHIRGVNRMPRWLAGLLSKRRTGPEFRMYTYGLGGYRRLFRAAGFGDLRFYAAVPTCRAPRELIPLDRPTVFDWYAERLGVDRASHRWRAVVAKRAFRIGLLPHLAPHLGIVAARGDER
jgi:SAM-dependent methyltransferase